VGSGERQVVGGELVENTWRETTYVVHTTIIILSSSVRWRRPWTGGEGGIERGVVRAAAVTRGAEKTHTNVGRSGARGAGAVREGSTGRRCRERYGSRRRGGGQGQTSPFYRAAASTPWPISTVPPRTLVSPNNAIGTYTYAVQRDRHASHTQTITRRFSVYF